LTEGGVDDLDHVNVEQRRQSAAATAWWTRSDPQPQAHSDVERWLIVQVEVLGVGQPLPQCLVEMRRGVLVQRRVSGLSGEPGPE